MAENLRSLGDIRKTTSDDRRLLVTAERGILELAAFEVGFRVRISARKRLPAYRSAAVANMGAPMPLRLTHDRAIRAGANGFEAVVEARPLGLGFRGPHQTDLAQDRFVGLGEERIVIRKQIEANARIYGLGQKTGWLDKRGRRYRMRNTDVWLEHPGGIGPGTDPLYASFPFLIVHSQAVSYGIFVDNSEFCEFDLTHTGFIEVTVPAQVLTYYVLPGPTLADVLRQYCDLTGRIELPALWTLGFHQCRWSYATDKELRRIARIFRRRKIPLDAVWADIDYMNGYRLFTWNSQSFPQPRKLVLDLAQAGVKTVTILDPGIKVDDRYALYREGKREGHLLKLADGSEYHGSVWPGECAFPDFHLAATRRWWARHVRRWLAETRVEGLWIDMNEPAARDVNGSIMDVRHKGGKLPHGTARNTYALEMARATHAAMSRHDPDGRPFILTRAGFSGMQRFAAMWCGDNSSCWEHLAASLPMLMNLGLSGMPFVGVDIGGFGGDTSGELLARWTQVGAFYPFCRNHSARGTRHQEPWTFGPEIERICRKYIGLRYRLLPYLYTLLYEASRNGAPVVRPLVWHYPTDPRTFNLNDQFMLGPDLMAAPVLAPGLSARSVYLPRDRWFEWDTDDCEGINGPGHVVAEAPIDRLPLFVRGGAIIPTWPPPLHTAAVQCSELALHIWPGNGDLDLYEDDGQTSAYRKGVFRLIPFHVREDRGNLTLTLDKPAGGYDSGRSHWVLAFHGLTEPIVRLDGRTAAGRKEGHVFYLQVRDDGLPHMVEVRFNAC
jgi:alpha-glucosidase